MKETWVLEVSNYGNIQARGRNEATCSGPHGELTNYYAS